MTDPGAGPTGGPVPDRASYAAALQATFDGLDPVVDDLLLLEQHEVSELFDRAPARELAGVLHSDPRFRRFPPPDTLTSGLTEAGCGLAGGTRRWLAGEWQPPARVVRGAPLTFDDYSVQWLRERDPKPRAREGDERLLRRYLAPVLPDAA